MILADTSVWVGPSAFRGRAVRRASSRRVLRLLDGLRSLPVAREDEVRMLIERRRLLGRGIGFVNVSPLASCLLVPGTSIWTRDRKLDAVANDLGLAIR